MDEARESAAWGSAQDWAAVARHLDAAGHRLDLSVAPRRLSGGLANLNFRVCFDGGPAVFRRPPPGKLAHGASDMAREAKVLDGLHPAFPLAPRLLFAGLGESPVGAPFLLIEWRAGVAVGGTLPPPFRAGDAGWMMAELAGALARLHALHPDEVGLGDLGRSSGFGERQLKGWARRAEAAFGAEAPPALAPLLARLEATLPADPPARLLHMDAKFDNLLVDPQARAATALIDWDMGTLGTPAFDLAVLLSYWIEPADPEGVHPLEALPSLVPGWPPRAAMIAAYADAAGAVPGDLPWHLALARLRLATAWMQLYRLWQQGALPGARYSGFPRLSSAILAHALDRFGDL